MVKTQLFPTRLSLINFHQHEWRIGQIRLFTETKVNIKASSTREEKIINCLCLPKLKIIQIKSWINGIILLYFLILFVKGMAASRCWIPATSKMTNFLFYTNSSEYFSARWYRLFLNCFSCRHHSIIVVHMNKILI